MVIYYVGGSITSAYQTANQWFNWTIGDKVASQSDCRRIRRDPRSEGHCDIVTAMIYLFATQSHCRRIRGDPSSEGHCDIVHMWHRDIDDLPVHADIKQYPTIAALQRSEVDALLW